MKCSFPFQDTQHLLMSRLLLFICLVGGPLLHAQTWLTGTAQCDNQTYTTAFEWLNGKEMNARLAHKVYPAQANFILFTQNAAAEVVMIQVDSQATHFWTGIDRQQQRWIIRAQPATDTLLAQHLATQCCTCADYSGRDYLACLKRVVQRIKRVDPKKRRNLTPLFDAAMQETCPTFYETLK